MYDRHAVSEQNYQQWLADERENRKRFVEHATEETAMTALSRKALTDAGYRTHEVRHKMADLLFQKVIRCRHGKTLYFINIFWYASLPGLRCEGLQPEVQFHRGQLTFDVVMHTNQDTTIEAIEQFFAEVYQNMNATPEDDGQ